MRVSCTDSVTRTQPTAQPTAADIAVGMNPLAATACSENHPGKKAQSQRSRSIASAAPSRMRSAAQDPYPAMLLPVQREPAADNTGAFG